MGQNSSSRVKREEEEEEAVTSGEVVHVYDNVTELVPDECLALVFQKLNNEERNICSLVCKRWHCVDGQDRQRLNLKANKDMHKVLPALLRRFENVTKLALKCERKSPGLDDRALVLVGKHCKQLRKLKLKGCKDVTDEGMEAFAETCGPLKKLSFCSCGFGARGLNAVVKHCTSLEDLTVKRLRGLHAGPQQYVQPGSGKIRRLCLKDLYNAQLFAPLIAGSKHLHTLMLSKNTGDWDKLLEIITDHVPGLVELHIEKLQLSDRGLHFISRWKNLEVLYVGKSPKCTNHGLSAVAYGCRRLRKLHVDGSKASSVGDEGLITIARKCKELQELVLISLNATVASINTIAMNCPSLERLALCNSQTFGDSELSCIAAKCVSLKKLCIKACPISDTGIEALASGCPNLVKIKVKKCQRVTPGVFTWLKTSRGSLVVTVDWGTPDGQDDLLLPRDPSRVVQGASDHRNRSPLARARLAIIAGRLFVACNLLRRPSPRDA